MSIDHNLDDKFHNKILSELESKIGNDIESNHPLIEAVYPYLGTEQEEKAMEILNRLSPVAVLTYMIDKLNAPEEVLERVGNAVGLYTVNFPYSEGIETRVEMKYRN